MKTKLLKALILAMFALSIGATALSANAAPKPFLIQGKLPHMTGMIKILWDDEDLALTKQQKEKLLVVRKDTLTAAKSLNKQIIALENSIVKATKEGKSADELKEDVYKLAKLRADATIAHIKCIYNTSKILTKKQLDMF